MAVKDQPQPKINESYVSMALGAIVVLVIGILIFNYFSKINKSNKSSEQAKVQESAQSSSLPTATSSATNVKPVSLSVTSSEETYTVVHGDSLWKISEKFYGSGFNWKLIADANNLVNPRVIHSGNVLKIPSTSAKVATLPSTGISGNSISGGTYVVVRGDTLWSIAVRAYGDGFAWNKIAQANNNINPRNLKVGMTLTISR